MKRADWIATAVGTAITAVLLTALYVATGFPYPWMAVPVAVVVYPLAGWVLDKAISGCLARRRRSQ